MKNTRNIARHLFSLTLSMLGLISWVTPAATLPVQSDEMTRVSVNTWSSNGPGVSIQSLAIDPGNSNIVYAGAERGVFKSTDGGTTWSNVGLSGYRANALAIDFVNPSILYAGTSCWCAVHAPGERLQFKSTDGGASWSNKNSPIVFDISLLIMDPSSPNTLYAGSAALYFNGNSGIELKSTDSGETWKGLATTEIAPWGWAIDPFNPQILYGPGMGLFKSTDGGENWSATSLTDVSVSVVAIDPITPSILYAAALDYDYGPTRGMFKSTDSGASWFAINNGLANLIGTGSGIATLAINPSNPNILYAGTSASDVFASGSGVFRSVDGGASWEPFNYGLTNLSIRALAIPTNNPNTVYAATAGGVFKIIDNIPPPFASPKIISASVAGKKLFVFGENFYPNAVILINGEEQITKNDGENPQSALIGKKAGKKIKPGDKLQVQNPNGTISQEFTFTGL